MLVISTVPARSGVFIFLFIIATRFSRRPGIRGLSQAVRKTGIRKFCASLLIKVGNAALRGKPNDIRAILESEFVALVDGEEQGKMFRLAIEMAKIDQHLKGDFGKRSIKALMPSYSTPLALEQDASSSGAQIIALTTRNKKLAELSNVIPTRQKKRLYDEIAALTFDDPRFKELNKKLGLTEKELRKAAKAANMVNERCHVEIPLIAGNSLVDNQQPSLSREALEGSTTKTYYLEQIMKSVGCKCIRNVEHS